MRKILGASMENLTAWVMWRMGFIDPWLRLFLSSYTEQGNMYKTDCDYCIKIIHEENLPDALGKTFWAECCQTPSFYHKYVYNCLDH